MIRRKDWNARLNKTLATEKLRPFAFDKRKGNDCCRFAARLVKAMTGERVMAGFDYATEADAWAQIEAAGGLRQFLGDTFGPWRRPAFAKRGDVMLKAGGKAVGICLGARVAIFNEATGYSTEQLSAFVAAYPIAFPEE